jgi:adenylyltransferase/sulfurtransferase
MFSLTAQKIDPIELSKEIQLESAGALVTFEGWVRDHNEGKKVLSLEYQIYPELALKEGEKILSEAKVKFNLHSIRAVHREGHLKLGEIAIWIGATSSHRDDAFKATRYVIDEIKYRLPVWKKEHYVDQKAEWVFCRHHHHHVHFSENDFYAKQSSLVDQAKLKNAKVLVVGAGGLGHPVLMNLAAAGVGHLTIVDPDKISISNIHRQVLFSSNLVGEKKADIAQKKLLELNPFIHIDSVVDWVKLSHIKHDLVIDCTDNLQTKYFLHDACLKLRVPLISASVYKQEGQVRTFVPGMSCLRCLGPVTPDDSLIGNCNDAGVLGAVTGVIGSIEASEAIEFLSSGTNSTITHTLYLNLKDLSQLKVKNFKQEGCLICLGKVEIDEEGIEVREGKEILDIRNLTDEEVFAMRPHGLALCCHKGVRSMRLAKKLRENGVDAYSLKGGACSL